MAPSAFGRWGRGPTSNGEACSDCHVDQGRGRPPERPDEALRAGIVRLSTGSTNSPQPHPLYGDQLQPDGVLGAVPGEGEVFVEWIEHVEHYADGQALALRRPVLRFDKLAFGDLGEGTLTSLRMAPPLHGIGLFEQVPLAVLRDIAAQQRAHGLGGRLNHLHTGSASESTAVGRFGLKANQPSLLAQIATALHEDLGVTSPLFPAENCPPAQAACAAHVVGKQPEIEQAELEALAAYLHSLPPATPAGAPAAPRGEALFAEAGCVHCHRPRLPVNSGLRSDPGEIAAYTDLLIHDLGEGLADGRPDGEAGGRDWRTAPLWGLGSAADGDTLLHDGRARSIEEAILWHGGEAQPARERFRSMRKSDRDALVAFLRTL